MGKYLFFHLEPLIYMEALLLNATADQTLFFQQSSPAISASMVTFKETSGRYGPEQNVGEPAVIFSGYPLHRKIQEIAEAAYCLMPFITPGLIQCFFFNRNIG